MAIADSPTKRSTDKPATRAPAPQTRALSPAMQQYVDQKKRVGEAVLLFRMGDFYETFYDDAVLCSKVLGIALTSRDKNSENPIPLAGIPYHALDGYLKKLVVAGYKVAISEQLEDAKQAKGVIKRDVVRIVTAGTLTDESLLSERDDNTMAAVCLRDKSVGLALIELASGRFEVIDVTRDTLLDELVRAQPAELLIDDDRNRETERLADELHQLCNTSVSRRPIHEFSTYQAERSLLAQFGVSTLEGFGFAEIDASLCAAGCVIQYLQETQRSSLTHITAIRQRITADYMQLDHSSWRSLEIERTLRSGAVEGTLLWAIDRTVHAIGGRMLRRWLRMPLTDVEPIVRRQDAVAYMVDEDVTRSEVRLHLKNMADVERIAGRVALGRTSPRDLASLGATLRALPSMAERVAESRIAYLGDIAEALTGLDELAGLLIRAIKSDPPPTTREGGYIADGFDAELDRLRTVGSDGRQWLAEYQQREIERTGIASLKVGFNRVFGYYIEISNAHHDQAPPEYVRKQTIKNAERFITDELKKYETDVLTARDRAIELELKLFEQVREQVAGHIEALMRLADAIGRLDCVAGLAELAIERRYVRPEFVEGGALEILDGRHPVLDRTLGDGFVPNDTIMSPTDARVFVITGPNMAGKSTFIRQTALLTLLAQTGSFVPARAMTCSIVDRLFARVGSSDEIMRGQSTFMVEMTEAANILHNATERSLVVLDELGRGTSTFDGVSLAWAITEHLANEVKCKALIATHYHELIELADLLTGVRNFNVAVRESQSGDGDGVVFLHKIVEGGASKSYGIHVAGLAGIPKTVIERSREILDELQRGFERESRTPQLTKKKTRDDSQLALFRDPGEALLEELRGMDPDKTTPIEALKRIQEWKNRFG